MTLIGMKFRVSSNVGAKGFDASENYFADTIDPQHRSLAAICYALIASLRLMLHSAKTVVYFDAPQITHPLEETAAA